MGHMSARTEMVSIPNWYVYVSFYVLLPHILRHTHTHTHTHIYTRWDQYIFTQNCFIATVY